MQRYTRLRSATYSNHPPRPCAHLNRLFRRPRGAVRSRQPASAPAPPPKPRLLSASSAPAPPPNPRSRDTNPSHVVGALSELLRKLHLQVSRRGVSMSTRLISIEPKLNPVPRRNLRHLSWPLATLILRPCKLCPRMNSTHLPCASVGGTTC